MASASSSVNGSGGSFCTLALVRCWAGLSFILPSRSARTNGCRITVAMLLRVLALQSKVASSPRILPIILADCPMLLTLHAPFVPLENLPCYAARSLLLIICPTARMSGASHPRAMSFCITRSVYAGSFAVRPTASLPHKIRCIARKSSLI